MWGKHNQCRMCSGTQRCCESKHWEKCSISSTKPSSNMGSGNQRPVCIAVFSPSEPSTSKPQTTHKHCTCFLAPRRQLLLKKKILNKKVWSLIYQGSPVNYLLALSLQAHRFQPKSQSNAKAQRIIKKKVSFTCSHPYTLGKASGIAMDCSKPHQLTHCVGHAQLTSPEKVICEHRSYKLKKERYHLSATENEGPQWKQERGGLNTRSN